MIAVKELSRTVKKVYSMDSMLVQLFKISMKQILSLCLAMRLGLSLTYLSAFISAYSF